MSTQGAASGQWRGANILGVLPEILLPATDAGAIGQMVFTVLATILAALLLRRRPQLRIFAIGVGVMLFSLMGLRTIH